MDSVDSTACRVLVVEDDEALAREIADALVDYGMMPAVAHDWASALDRLRREPPDAILLDQRLGAIDAVPLIPQLRAISAVPLVILTGNRKEVDRIVALEIGADDFLIKPVSGRELVARLRARLRRDAGDMPPRPGAWRFSAARRSLHRPDGSEVMLTAAELDLLALLAAHVGVPQTRDDLTRQVLGRPWRPDDRALDNLVLHLRKKLGAGGEKAIAAIRGRGYVFTAFPAA